ncbi:aminodeoxychorismate lyase [Ferrimonas sp. YFM]|uniref:aminodeoxychorismate lyase n=1 Tax=Ferrimonas sp. YFM TaxID=3028878 RepID=UPI002573AF8C|nr:aminodeoxychorismate lyase [Ferrimonas sp. YFM]BDY05059.1 4-amino-4-deoxychorismate lyase [Ferrimonas sp. YFM]
MSSWIDGVPSQSLGLSDRGLNLADGHFTTMLVREGDIELWPLHRQRLSQACSRLMMAQPDWHQVEATLAQATSGLQGLKVAKLLFTRGEQGRGYAASLHQPPRVILSLHPYPVHYLHWQQQGIRVGVADFILGNQPALAGLKTLGRTEQVLHRAEVDASSCDELLALDPQGRVLETSAANLFLCQGRVLVTPSLHRGGVAGVMRQQILRLAPELGWQIELRDLTRSDLAQAEAAFISNSLMGLVPITELAGRALVVSADIRSLQEALAQ